MKPQQTGVAIVGAGIIGCAIARELARRGAHVTLFERDVPGRSATWAAAGMLSPLAEAGGAGPFLDLADESLRLFPGFVQTVLEESGIDVEYRTTGKLHVSFGNADQELDSLSADAVAGRFAVSRLDRDAALALEPRLSTDITGAVLVGRDHRVNNRLLAQALIAAATAAGATLRRAAAVTAVTRRGAVVTGITLATGEHVTAEHVVIAAGAWSGTLAGLPRALPVRPVRGQMFAVDSRAAHDAQEAPALQRAIQTRRCYILPRDDGRLLVGATVEEVGFAAGPTPAGIVDLAGAAAEVLPLIADLPLVDTWSGFRPATPDRLPILGTDPDVAGLIYATGHFRNGILLTPVTARRIADVIAGAPAPAADVFGIGRFDGN